VFGEIESGVFAACCQNGLGTAKGTVSGKLVAELASDQHSALLADQQGYAEPARLPPAPLARIGASVKLRWGEYRAGREL
jgi:glycine/D-amino acid oxidase-like deaminating enzyme